MERAPRAGPRRTGWRAARPRAPRFALLAIALWAGIAAGSARAGVDRVLLVTIDTLRADHVGAYGGPVRTPALDRLAAEGVRVEGAVTPTPSTAPAHASLFTGLHPWHHRVLDNAMVLEEGPSTLAERLRAAGFATAAFVASYIVHPRFGLARGFDLYHFEPDQAYHWRGERRARFWARGEAVVAEAQRWITAHADQRFFVWVHLFDPHTPYRPPPGYAPDPATPVDLTGKIVPPGVRGERQLRDLIRAYRGEVAYADAQVGRLLERLRMLALLDGTAVVVTSDHGEGLGDHGHLEHGANLHGELVRVPLLVRAPGLAGGRTLRGEAQLEDLAPTLLALAGLAPPEGLDGVDLLDWLRGARPGAPRDAVLGQRKSVPGVPDLFFVRRGSDKWIGKRSGPGLRFDLERDPGERHGTLAPAPDGLAALLPPADAAEPAPRPPLDDETRRALEALGYVE